MKNILFPTDFSDNANHALEFALKIAYDFNAKLHIINTYQVPYTQAVPTTQKLLNALKESSITELDEYVKKIISRHEYKNLNIIYQAYEGSLINVITDLERNLYFDLIVLGTKGASGMKEMLIGSNAEQVVFHAKTSVYVIPKNASSFLFEKVALAIDLNPINDSSIFNSFLLMCKKYHTKVDLITVVQNTNDTKSEKTNIEILNSIFADLTLSYHKIFNSDVLSGLNNFVEQEKPVVLAAISRKHSFFETIFSKTITDKLTCRSKIPIFVIKEK
ncbi:MAG: universal stress protein [Flavobacteriales bacterium]